MRPPVTAGMVAGRSARARQAEGARRLLEEEGPEALTMRRLAERLGIRAPTLYKHLPDKAAVEAAIVATGLEDRAAAPVRLAPGGDGAWYGRPCPARPGGWDGGVR